MVAQGVDQVVGELPVALPGVAQQVQMGLLGLEAAQVVDGVEVRQARVVEQVLLRDAELGQQRLRDPVQRVQHGALLPLLRHLPPAEVLGVLLERGQLRQGVVAHQKLGQSGLGRIRPAPPRAGRPGAGVRPTAPR